jgi:hypothetical protein
MCAVFLMTLQGILWNACAVRNVVNFLVLKTIGVKELISTSLKIDRENFYKNRPLRLVKHACLEVCIGVLQLQNSRGTPVLPSLRWYGGRDYEGSSSV